MVRRRSCAPSGTSVRTAPATRLNVRTRVEVFMAKILSSQDSSCTNARVFAFFLRQLAIHENPVDALGHLMGVLVGRLVDDFCGVKDHDVRKGPGPQLTA